FPCGYLPIAAGNIRQQPFRAIWEEAPLFQELRDPDLLQGKCGLCEFKQVCGGCRARAYGMTGEYLGEEPFCIYEPDLSKRHGMPPLPLNGGGSEASSLPLDGGGLGRG
ncbi:MAG: hypothetical protein C4309_08905, partial [Chloroflexota bacterium]